MQIMTRTKNSQNVTRYRGKGAYNSTPDGMDGQSSDCDTIRYWDENQSLAAAEAWPVTVAKALQQASLQ